MRPSAVPFAAILLLAPAAARAQPAPRPLSLAEAVDLAQRGNPEVTAGAESIRAAEEHLAGTKALRLPVVHTEANVIFWDKELAFELPMAPPGTGTVIRDRLTASATVQVLQPLSPLLVIRHMIHLDQAGVAVARADLDRAKLDAGYRAAEAYLRVLQSAAVREVAHKSVDQLEAHLARAEVLKKGGLAQDADILRLQSARDQARQGLLQADAGAATGAHALALALGLPEDERIEVRDDLPDPPPPPPWNEEDAVRGALATRPELRAAHSRIAQGEAGRKVALSNYFPNVMGIAQFQRNEGQGAFSPKNSWFVGVNLTWDLWNWGKTADGVAEAAAHRRQAEIVAAATADQVAFDARRRAREAATAHQALEAAQSAVRAAEEAYRIRGIALGQGDATTTDVLDAETEVARARTQAVLARYDYYLAVVALARAVGATPVPNR